MRMHRLCLAVAVAAATTMGISAAQAQVKVKLEPFATGLNAPLAMVQPKGDDRMFVIEQWGRVMIVNKDGSVNGTPFLDIRNRIVDRWPDFDERGLLGIAFPDDFTTSGKFYVAYSGVIDPQGALDRQFWWDHNNVVSEFTVSADDPDAADPATERRLMTTQWPQFNHNGHWIGFGPDGMLYVSMGDGGYANDWGIGHNVTEGNGQDLLSPHGKIHRIDPATGKAPADNPFVGNDEAIDTIWAYGLRNPWRCSFDMGGENQLFCGDVQQNSYEEVDIVSAGDNMGWRKMEATHCFDYVHPDDHPTDCDKTGLVEPILEYPNCTAKPRGCLGISVTGGYVYRGAHEAWDGKYIFGDWSKSFGAMDGQIFVGTNDGGSWSMEVAETDMDGANPYILAFAQDQDGEVYALTSITTGPVGSLDTIYKIVPAE